VRIRKMNRPNFNILPQVKSRAMLLLTVNNIFMKIYETTSNI